jgi:tetratricopeptide (TPR) repeat protein
MKKKSRPEIPAVAPTPETGPDRLLWILAGLCMAVAVTIRIFVFLDVRILPDVTSDGLFYQGIAQKIADGTYWKEAGVFAFSPLYVFYLAAVRMVAGDSINAVRISQLVIGLGSIGLVFLIARTVLNRRASFIALCLAALYLPFVFFEVQILGITLVLALLLLSVYLLLAAVGRGSRILLALAGWFLGVAALGAPNLLLLGAPVVVWLLFFAGRTPELSLSGLRGWKPGGSDIIRAALFSVFVFVGILPATLWNYHASGQLVPISSQGGINFYIGNNPQATGFFTAPPGMEDSLNGINIKDSKRVAEAETGRSLTVNEVSAHWFGKGLHFIASDPSRFVRLTLHKAFLYVNRYETPLDVDFDSFKAYSAALRLPLLGFGVIAVAGLAGLILACRGFGRYSLFVLLFATYSVTVIAFFVSDRYRLPAVPFLILFSALGIDWIWDRLRQGRIGSVFLGMGLLLPLVFFVYSPVGYEASPASLSFNMAMSYMTQKDLPRAKAELERSVRDDPGWGEAHFQLASVSHELGDDEGALTELSVFDRRPDINALYLRGRIDAGSGRLTSARKAFAAALSLNPNYAEARQQLAAIDARIAAETPEAKRARGGRLLGEGGQLQQSGRHRCALANLMELRDGDFKGVDLAFINTAIGFESAQMGRMDDAEQAFEAALVLSPQNPVIHKNLAILEIKRGDRTKADAHFQEFVRLAPNDPQVEMVREMLTKPTGGFQ